MDNESDKGKVSLVDTLGVKRPILDSAKSRQHSYGSCDEAPIGHLTQDGTPLVHKKRHQIGSEVLDFGESPAAWPNAINQRIAKRTSQRAASSFLPGVDASSTPTSTGKRGFFRSLGSDARYGNSESLPPTSVGLIRALSKRSITSKRGKTALSLFGLDGSMADTPANSGTELGVLTNKVGRPRANADAAIQIPPGSNTKSQRCACPKPSLELDVVRSRIVSWSRYLDEISRIGANGAPMASSLTPDTELTPTIDPSCVVEAKCKARTPANQSAGLPMQEENPWQTCESTNTDSKTTSRDLNKIPELKRDIQPSMRVSLDIGEALPTNDTANISKQDVNAVSIIMALHDHCPEDTHAMTAVEQSHSTAKSTASPSPKRTTSNTSTRFNGTTKSRAQSRDRKPFVVPGLADIEQVAEASAVIRATPQAKRSVSKQRSQGKAMNKKDGGIITTCEKK